MPADANAPLLTCRGLEVCYDGAPALQGVGFALRPGQILAVVGASGSGKSTLLNAVPGLLPANGRVTGGEILFAGQALTALTERQMQRIRGAQIGMVFQDAEASLCPVRTIGSQVYEAMAAHRRCTRAEAKAAALALFARLGLDDAARVWGSYPFELSGGMNQRVGLALAMLLQPPLLLADEPTSALDVLVQRQAAEGLLRLRRTFGTAILLVTHDMALAAALADEILVLHQGRVAEYGPARRLLTAPQSQAARRLLAAAPQLQRSRP